MTFPPTKQTEVQMAQARRVSDKQALDIDNMILEADDPKDRAFLIILNNINYSVIASTSTIREIGDRLEGHISEYEKHAEREESYINKGRGAWKVAAWVIAIAQVAAGVMWVQSAEDRKEILSVLTAKQTTLDKHEVRITVLENKNDTIR